jgi:hypothetical protein
MIPPLREPTRSLGIEREEKASARFGRDDKSCLAIGFRPSHRQLGEERARIRL